MSRCEDAGLVKRKPSTVDRRLVEVHLLPKGRKTLAKLAQQHALELSHLAEATRLASEIDSEAGDGEA